MLLLALLCCAALAAALVLFLQFRLENIRQHVQQTIAARMGADLVAERVQIIGLRGIRIRDFSTQFSAPGGAAVKLDAPEASIYVDLADLISGQLTVDRFQVDGATIHLERPLTSDWTPPRLSDIAEATGLNNLIGFRLVGKQCRVHLRNFPGNPDISLQAVDFNLLKFGDAPDFVGRLSGQLDSPDPPQSGGVQAPAAVPVSNRPGTDSATQALFSASFHFINKDDYDLRLQTEGLDQSIFGHLFPAATQWVKAGKARAAVRVTAYPNQSAAISLESSFEDLELVRQPELLAAVTGSLRAFGLFDMGARVLTLANATVQTADIHAQAEGTVSFSGPEPGLDLHLVASRLPLETLMAEVLSRQPEYLQPLQVEVQAPYELRIALGGTPGIPDITLEASLDGGRIVYAPLAQHLPKVEAEISRVRVNWNSATAEPEAFFNVVRGEVLHAATGMRATKIAGALSLTPARISLTPLQAEIFGAPVSASLEYVPGEQQGRFSVSGMFDLPGTTPATALPDIFQVTGPVHLRCAGEISADHILADLSLDATRAEVAFSWWLNKPPGVGANLEAVNLDYRTGKSLRLSGTAAIDTARINTIAQLGLHEKQWRLESLRAKSDAVDVATINRCMRIPYTATGGVARDASFEWKQAGTEKGYHDVSISGHFDRLLLEPEEASHAFVLNDSALSVAFVNRGTENKGTLELTVDSATTPPFGAKWFLPLRPRDPALAQRFSQKPRAWTYALAADALELPPWKGTAFKGQAYSRNQETGLSTFQAQVDGGTLAGEYRFESEEHISHLVARWEAVPATYLLEHLKFPPALTGISTGNVQYVVDQDDPNTLRGNGAFSISSGQFSADFLVSLLENRLQGNIGSLPPSLRFDTLSAEVELDGDRVHTRNLRFESAGLTMTGEGHFVLQGDMDYTVKVAVSPEVAQRIPALRDNFSIEGHRLTQSSIELAFHVTGPAFNPRGAVAGLPPLGVTLVSSAVGVTSEAIRIIDMPRQILLDLLRLGGGIVGAGQ